MGTLSSGYASRRTGARRRRAQAVQQHLAPTKEPSAWLGGSSWERRTLLHMAAWEGRAQDICGLVAAGVAVDVPDAEGHTPLCLAAKAGHTRLDLLFRTHEEHQLEAVRVLLAAGADVNASTASQRMPLHFAARGGSEGVVRALLASGAEIDAPDMFAWTPLHHAAFRGHITVVQALLLAGAEPLLRTTGPPSPSLTSQTPRGLAEGRKAGQGQEHCAQLLWVSEEEPCLALVLRRRVGELTQDLQECRRALRLAEEAWEAERQAAAKLLSQHQQRADQAPLELDKANSARAQKPRFTACSLLRLLLVILALLLLAAASAAAVLPWLWSPSWGPLLHIQMEKRVPVLLCTLAQRLDRWAGGCNRMRPGVTAFEGQPSLIMSVLAGLSKIDELYASVCRWGNRLPLQQQEA